MSETNPSTAGTENLLVGQSKVVNVLINAPAGVATPPAVPTFTATPAGIVNVSPGTPVGTLNAAVWGLPVTLEGVAAGEAVINSTINGVDQGTAGDLTVQVTAAPVETCAWDTTTLS
jgi:hypothetical protein